MRNLQHIITTKKAKRTLVSSYISYRKNQIQQILYHFKSAKRHTNETAQRIRVVKLESLLKLLPTTANQHRRLNSIAREKAVSTREWGGFSNARRKEQKSRPVNAW